MRILVASSSVFRQRLYCQAIENLGHGGTITSGGLECTEQLRLVRPDVLILEAPLTWGGADAVLDVVQREFGEQRIPVILVAVGMGSIDWFQLSRYRIDNILFRVPTVRELERAITGATEQQPADTAQTEASDGDHRLEPHHPQTHPSQADEASGAGRSSPQQPHWHSSGSHSVGHSW
jgi:hypothetical protein